MCLRARNPAQWEAVLEEPHALAGDPQGEAVAALPPRRRSERGPLLERLQAMSSDLGPAPTELEGAREGVTYVLNPELEMSSGKVVAQVAHAAVMAAAALPGWAAAGAPGRLVAPRGFAELAARRGPRRARGRRRADRGRARHRHGARAAAIRVSSRACPPPRSPAT